MWEKSFSIIGYSVLSGTTSNSSDDKAKLVGYSICFLPGYLKKVHQILREDVFFFAGGSLGAMNGLYRYRKELLLRAAEGMSSPCKILWNEMLQIRLTVYPSLYIFGF